MTRLDRHVRLVRNKLAVNLWLAALAWSLLAFAAVVWLFIWVDRLFRFQLPRQGLWFVGGAVAAVIAAGVYALLRRPSDRNAAVAIDARLALQEKFSTALYARSMRDPFASAAVHDAERTAENVDLHNRFPVRWPRTFVWTGVVALCAALTAGLVKPMDLFGVETARKEKEQAKVEQTAAKKEIEKAIARIDAAPKSVGAREEMQIARQELVKLAATKEIKDASAARRTAQRAVDDVKSLEKKIKDVQSFAAVQKQNEEWRQLASQPIDESGPVGQAQAALAKGQISEAVAKLDKAVENFDKMSESDQRKSADQMQKFAAQLQQMANDPNVQKQIEKSLQQQGATQQQAQQMSQLMQKAANGDKKAMQQMQQMQNQLLQQMNNGQGPTQQQIAQMKQMMQRMQGQANSQAQAQQLAQAAQQLAQAMQQANSQGQKGQGQQQSQQQGQGQQSAQARQQGQQGQQGQSGASQGAGQGGSKQMANAQQSMRQQLQQMQSSAADAEANAAQQQNDGGDNGDGGDDLPDNQQAAGNGQGNDNGGEFRKGDPNRPGGGGFGGPGQAAGGRPKGQSAPFGVKQEVTRYQTLDKGKILASTFVKADSIKGESKIGLSEAVASAENDATDEVQEERVSRQAQSAVKEYFQTIHEDASK